jgi:hypothetical protein
MVRSSSLYLVDYGTSETPMDILIMQATSYQPGVTTKFSWSREVIFALVTTFIMVLLPCLGFVWRGRPRALRTTHIGNPWFSVISEGKAL